MNISILHLSDLHIMNVNGTYSDIVDLLSSQEKIMSLIEEFENKIEDIWQ